MPRFSPDGWSPVAALRALGNFLILRLVHHVGWYEPILPGHQGQQDLTLEPGLVVGESQAMKRVVEELRSAVRPRGPRPPPRRAGGGQGAPRPLPPPLRPAEERPLRRRQLLRRQALADRGRPLRRRGRRREGKLVLADGGTLFLAHGPGAIFFWKGRPVFLGPSALGFGKGGHVSGAQVFYVPDPTGASAKLGEFYEVCKEDFIWGVASNADSYAAIGAKEVFFGDFADAPDLP